MPMLVLGKGWSWLQRLFVLVSVVFPSSRDETPCILWWLSCIPPAAMFPADNTHWFSDRSWVRQIFSNLSSFDVPSPFTFWLMILHVWEQVSLGRDFSILMCPASCCGGLWLVSASWLDFLELSWETPLFLLSLLLSDQCFLSFVSNFSSSSPDTVLTISSECRLLFEAGFQVV